MSGILTSFIGRVAGVVTDAYYNLVTLLLPGNGTNGAQNNTFLDSSSNNFTITRNGNTTQGTFSPFSQTGWGNFFVASASSVISTPNNSAFNFGAPSGNTNDFCVEFFVYPTGTAVYAPVATGYSASNYWMFNLNRTSGGTNTAGYVSFYMTDSFFVEATSGLVVNTWNHIAAVRTGTTVSLFVNGTRGATATSSTNPNPTNPLWIGGEGTALGRYLDGYVSNVRIIKGSTLPYSASSSSITVPTATLTAITGTTVLTCQSNRFLDNSSNALVFTPSGTPSVQAFSPFAPTAAYSAATVGGSGYFDGTGDYLSVAHNSALSITGNVDASIEFWVYPISGSGVVVNKSGVSGSVFPNYSVGVNSNGSISFFLGNSGSPGSSVTTITTSAGTVPFNAWSHVVCTKTYVGGGSVNNYRVMINGILSNNGTQNNASDGNPGALTIGFEPSSTDDINAYISQLRIFNTSIPTAYQTSSTTNGTSIYTVPTTPITAGTSSICTLFTNAGITDATAKNVLETVGNAQISTTQSKFGGSSMYFDGTGDWLTLPSSQNLIFGLGDLTIEGFFYCTANNTYQRLVASSGLVIQIWNQNCLSLIINSTNYFAGTNNTNTGSVDSGNLPINQWNHIAVVRSGGNFYAYINGTLKITVTAQSTYSLTSAIQYIGAGTSEPFFGYIDDLRITKYARYSGSTLTVPTAALPLQ